MSPPSGSAATQSRILHLCLISIQVMSNPNAGPGKRISAPPRSISQGHLHLKMHVSPPYRSFLTSHSQVYCLTSLHAPFQINQCPKILQFMLHLTSDQVMMLAFHIHPFHVSHPSRSRELLISSILDPPQHIQVSRCVSQPNPGPISQVSIFVFHLHPGS